MKIVKFVQENCTPCKMLAQTLTAMGLGADEEILITDKNRDEIREKFNVMSTPTMIAFDGDKEVTRLASVGYSKIQEFFAEVK